MTAEKELREHSQKLLDARAMFEYTMETGRLVSANGDNVMLPWRWIKFWRNDRAIQRRFKEFKRMERAYEEKWGDDEPQS